MILMSSSLNSFLQLLGVLVIFVFVLLITWLTTRWLGGYQRTQMEGRSVRVIDTVRIAGNKYIQVIKTGEVYLVIAVGKDEVTLLAQLTEEQFGEAAEQLVSAAQQPMTFQETLDKIKNHFPKKQD